MLLPWWLTLPARDPRRLRCSAALWALIPAWLQAKRGSHVVITTIMFNFIAAALMVYLLVNVLKPAGPMAPQTRTFADGGAVAEARLAAGDLRLDIGSRAVQPLLPAGAAVACRASGLLIWRTRFGYEMRTVGTDPRRRASMPASRPRASSSSPC